MPPSGVDDQNNQQISSKKTGDKSYEKTGSNSIVRGRSLYEFYEPLNEISRGNYGVVYRARDLQTGEIVALKHLIIGATESTWNEFAILSSLLPHPSIVGFRRFIHDSQGGVYLAMEYLEYDLNRYMGVRRSALAVDEVKNVMYQILLGLEYLHKMGTMHRDIKPSNILVDSCTGQAKICDFGLAHVSGMAPGVGGGGGEVYTGGVGTLWYMAPEILVGSDKYSYAVDMWSVGCTMAELLLKEVLFKGDSVKQQLRCIHNILGPPGSKLLRHKLAVAAPLLTATGFDLLQRLLKYIPACRITVGKALDHDWFKGILIFLIIVERSIACSYVITYAYS